MRSKTDEGGFAESAEDEEEEFSTGTDEAETESPAEETDTEENTETTDSSIIESGTCGANGDNLTWTLTGDGTLTISGSGEKATFTIKIR